MAIAVFDLAENTFYSLYGFFNIKIINLLDSIIKLPKFIISII